MYFRNKTGLLCRLINREYVLWKGGTKREIYSGYEPSWRYAHAASLWIKGMEDEGVIPKPKEILKSSNVDEELGYIRRRNLRNIHLARS